MKNTKDLQMMELVQIPDIYNMPIMHIVVNTNTIGYIRFYMDEHKKVVYLYHIVIHNLHKRQGYATQAMDQFLERFTGYDIHLHIANYSDAAKAFWKKYFRGKFVYELDEKDSYLIKNSNLNRNLVVYDEDNSINQPELINNDCY